MPIWKLVCRYLEMLWAPYHRYFSLSRRQDGTQIQSLMFLAVAAGAS